MPVNIQKDEIQQGHNEKKIEEAKNQYFPANMTIVCVFMSKTRI